MATYKKRGFKNKASSSKAEALENKSTTANVFNTLDEGSSQTQKWVERNQNKILGLVAIISIIVIGVFAYSKLIKEPKESSAFNKMYFAQKKFDEAVLINNDSMYNIALNGDDLNMGMLQIINEFGGTNAANLAHYYSGIMYLKMNDYPNSIKYLSEFSSDDILLSSLATGSIGDAFAELNQFEEAFDYYVKASNNDNNYTSPIYLYKAGLVAMKLNKFKKAENYFTNIKLDYPDSAEAKNIDAYISKAIASYQ
jgi:tetratricopeptide (TPR) repeat protein